MDSNFNNSELLLRAVYPVDRRPKFWKKNGNLSSAALKDSNGLSVDRTGNRTLVDSLAFIRQNLTGNIVSIPYVLCLKVKASVFYLPSKNNPYHSEIHGSMNQKELSDTQAIILAHSATIYRN